MNDRLSGPKPDGPQVTDRPLINLIHARELTANEQKRDAREGNGNPFNFPGAVDAAKVLVGSIARAIQQRALPGNPDIS